jgi:hypothetical protein
MNHHEFLKLYLLSTLNINCLKLYYLHYLLERFYDSVNTKLTVFFISLSFLHSSLIPLRRKITSTEFICQIWRSAYLTVGNI